MSNPSSTFAKSHPLHKRVLGVSLFFLILLPSFLQAFPSEVRIGLLRFGLPSNFWINPADNGLEIIDPLKNQRLFSGRAAQVQVKSDNGHLLIFIDGQERLRSDHTLVFSATGRQIRYLWFGSTARDRRAYRGSVAIIPGMGRMLAINLVQLEEYLRSVVPSEIGDHAPYSALQAQAIAARTYAFRNLNRHGPTGFDLCDGVHCQAYSGLQREFAGGTAAVQETAGMVLMHDGKPANTVYHAHCGGSLSSSQQVWGGVPVPYLIAHADSLQPGSAFCDWETASRQAKDTKSGKGKKTSAPPVSPLSITRAPSAKAVHMGSGVVVANASAGTGPVLFLHGGAPLEALPPKTTVRGHRVGMCQDGAIGMGRAGYSMSGILAFYYPGTHLVKFQIQGGGPAAAQVHLLPPPAPKAVSQLKAPASPPRMAQPRVRKVQSTQASPTLGRSSSPLDSPRPTTSGSESAKRLPDFRKWFWCNLQPLTHPVLAPEAHFASTRKGTAEKKKRQGTLAPKLTKSPEKPSSSKKSPGSPAKGKSKKKANNHDS